MLKKLGFSSKAGYIIGGAVGAPALLSGFNKVTGGGKELTRYVQKADPEFSTSAYAPINYVNKKYTEKPKSALIASAITGGLLGSALDKHIKATAAGEVLVNPNTILRIRNKKITKDYLKRINKLSGPKGYMRGVGALATLGVLAGVGTGIEDKPNKKNLALASVGAGTAVGGLYAANLRKSHTFSKLKLRPRVLASKLKYRPVLVGATAAAGALMPILGHSVPKLERALKSNGKKITNTT